jgi:hypothetical protein
VSSIERIPIPIIVLPGLGPGIQCAEHARTARGCKSSIQLDGAKD